MTQDHQHLDPKRRAAVAWQPETPADILQTLAQDPNVVVRQNVLRVAQQNEDLELLEIFLGDPDPVIRAELALWPACPTLLLRRFKQDPSAALRGIMEHRTTHNQPESDFEHHEPERAAPLPAIDDDMPEQDEPTGAVVSTDKLPPVASAGSAPKPVPLPSRAPTAPPIRATPAPVRNPIVNPMPMPVRPSPLPLKSPMVASVPHHAPAPIPAPIPAPPPAPAPFQPPPAREEWAAPAPIAAPSMPTLAEEEEPEAAVAPKAPSPLPGKGEIRIHLTASDKTQSELTFAKDLLVVGRVMGNDIVLAQGNVSKNHCRIFVFNNQLYVEDLKSTNGTQLNKNNITPREPTALHPNDELGVGSATLKLSLVL